MIFTRRPTNFKLLMMELFSQVQCFRSSGKVETYKTYISSDKQWYYSCNDEELRVIDKERVCAKYSGFKLFAGCADKYFVKCPLNSFAGYEDYQISMTNEIEAYEKIQRAGGHENICGYHGCVENGGFVDSIMLTKYSTPLSGVENLTCEQKVKIIEGLIEGVRFLHEIGIVHGDINPLNLMLGDNFDVKIIDFDSVGIHNSKAGTDGYMSDGYFKTTSDDLFSVTATIKYILEK